jgi:ferredoxin
VNRPPSIHVEADVCMGSGTCLFHAPHVFAIDPETNVARVADPWGDPLDDVLDAVDACPTQAIHVEDQRP